MEIITLYENKFSIVVPTMWKYAPFTDLLDKLVQHELVGEIIIINNDMNATPNASVLNHPKIKLHNFKLNIFVNPAWNYGAGMSEYSNVCIMNDDIDFNISIFDFLSNRLSAGKFVVFSQSHSKLPAGSLEPIDTVYYDGSTNIFDIGCLMFISKQDWINIPAGLDIYHGDSWLWDTMLAKFNQNYYIKNLEFSTPNNVTANTIPNREFIYLERECRLYVAMLNNFKNKL